jgi:hypothetical protein
MLSGFVIDFLEVPFCLGYFPVVCLEIAVFQNNARLDEMSGAYDASSSV